MPRFDLPLRSVQSFMAVVRMRSFTEAANALNLTQPAVTQNVAKLEDRLGCKLLDRNGGALVLTQAGRALLPAFERIEKDVQAVFQRARGLERPARETVRIGAPTSLIANIVAPVMIKLEAEQAPIYIALVEVDDDSVYDLVRAGDVELAITSIPGGDAHLEARSLIEDRPCVVFPMDHPLTGEAGAVKPRDVAGHRLIRLPAGTIGNSFIEALGQQAERELDFATEATRLMTIDILIRAGIGIAVLPGFSARLIGTQGLSFRTVDLGGITRRSQLIMSRQVKASKAAQHVADELISRARAVRDENLDICVSNGAPELS